MLDVIIKEEHYGFISWHIMYPLVNAFGIMLFLISSVNSVHLMDALSRLSLNCLSSFSTSAVSYRNVAYCIVSISLVLFESSQNNEIRYISLRSGP